jgi:NADH-quinone oxidoreductase subunit A
VLLRRPRLLRSRRSNPTNRRAEKRQDLLMLRDYLPVLLQILVAIGFAVSALLVSVLLGKAGRRTRAKDTAYECGMLPEGGAQPRFSVKFYLVAMLFILFDVEIVFMYPWAVIYRETVAHDKMILWSMLSFVSVLMVGYVYALRKGVFDFRK